MAKNTTPKKYPNRLFQLLAPAAAVEMFWAATKSLSKGGKAKRGKEYEPKASIRVICDLIQSRSFTDVLEFLKNEDGQCDDLYHSTDTPINVMFLGVYDIDSSEKKKRETIEYCKRGDPQVPPKSIAFRTLRNILSEIKNNT